MVCEMSTVRNTQCEINILGCLFGNMNVVFYLIIISEGFVITAILDVLLFRKQYPISNFCFKFWNETVYDISLLSL